MRKYNKNKNGIILIVTIIIIIFSIIISVCYYKMRPVIISQGESNAETILLDSANEAVLSVLSQNKISYSDIVNLSKNDYGYVTSIETNIIEINYLKSNISNSISKNISEKEYYNVTIPFGTFLSNVYTNGMGPNINLKMQLTATAVVDFTHEFKTAGINQVLHIINVKIDITGKLILAGYSDSFSVSTSSIAAQTVIVGVVPDAYTNVIESKGSNTSSLINDYKASTGEEYDK